MPPPSKQQVKVATDTLRNEATVWLTQSDTLTTIANKASGLSLTRLEAGVFQLIESPYDAMVTMITSHCREGSQRMEDIATTLRSVADTYEQEDNENLHAIDNLY
jgi:hypothetical protein